jgi:hypothetical protein
MLPPHKKPDYYYSGDKKAYGAVASNKSALALSKPRGLGFDHGNLSYREVCTCFCKWGSFSV